MPADASDWVAWITALAMLLFGGGGVAAWVKQHRDGKNGVRQETRAETDSLNARAVAIVETQFTFLVEPLRSEVESLRKELKDLKSETKTYQTLYQISVDYIRTLYSWIARHMPPDIEQTQIPAPPDELAGENLR